MKLNLSGLAILCLAATIITPTYAQSGGPDTYKAKCLMCHGADGMGQTPAGKSLKAASFKDPAIVKLSDADMTSAVTKGKNKMPAYAGKLTDTQIKGAIAYIRTLQK
jgi:mono/diheme cytochrome c family protein